MTVPSEIVGRATPVLLAFLAIHSRAAPTALVGTSLVLVDRDREPSASGAHERIAHETLYPPDETFHFSFVLLQEVEKRLRAFAGIASNDSMHDTPPPADVLHVNAAGT